MEELKPDVNVDSSPTPTQVEQKAEIAEQPQQTTTQLSPTPPQEAEEMVPVHKVWEWKRKYEDSVEKLPQLVEEGLQKVLSRTQLTQQREPSIAELEQYAIEHPEQRPFVEEKKEEIRLKKLTNEINTRLSADKELDKAERIKQDSLKYVMNTYPEAFMKDQSGQIAGWNNSNPITQQIAQLMRNTKLANDPEGLMAAADIAFARVTRMGLGKQVAKEQQLKAEVKDLQKRTLVEGGGKQNVQSVPAHRVAIEKVKQTGSMSDAREAVMSILKAKGVLGE